MKAALCSEDAGVNDAGGVQGDLVNTGQFVKPKRCANTEAPICAQLLVSDAAGAGEAVDLRLRGSS